MQTACLKSGAAKVAPAVPVLQPSQFSNLISSLIDICSSSPTLINLFFDHCLNCPTTLNKFDMSECYALPHEMQFEFIY